MNRNEISLHEIRIYSLKYLTVCYLINFKRNIKLRNFN